MAIELLDIANKNYSNKQGTEEHSSLLPEMQHMISQMYTKIESYNYVYNVRLLPNLEGYNVHYDAEKFKALERDFSQKMMKTSQNGIGVIR